MDEVEKTNILVIDPTNDEADQLKKASKLLHDEINIYCCHSISELDSIQDDPNFKPQLIIICDSGNQEELNNSLDFFKQDNKSTFIPKVIMSQNYENDFLNKIYTLGAHSYITKPNSYLELCGLLREILTYHFQTAITPTSKLGSHKNILIVEDEDSQVFLVREAIDDLGFTGELHFVKDGLEALDFLRAKAQYNNKKITPDLIILDLKLPRMSGLEFLKELDHIQDATSIPVTIISFSKNSSDIEAVNKRGLYSVVPYDVFLEAKKEKIKALINFWKQIAILPRN